MIRSKALPKRPIQHAVVLVGFKKSRRGLESKCVGSKARFHVGEFGEGLRNCFLQLPDIERSGVGIPICSGLPRRMYMRPATFTSAIDPRSAGDQYCCFLNAEPGQDKIRSRVQVLEHGLAAVGAGRYELAMWDEKKNNAAESRREHGHWARSRG